MQKRPWLKRRKKTDPEPACELPVLLGNKSNGEFYWEQTPAERKLREFVLRESDERARRLGLDRREFLASALGMTTSLWALNLAAGCGDASGGFDVSAESLIDCDAATELLAGDEFILDIQTHHIEDEETWRDRHPEADDYPGDDVAQRLTLYACDLDPRSECIGPRTYVQKVFLESDTSVAVLSGFPTPICDDATYCTNLNSHESMVFWRDFVNEAAGSQRMVQHCPVAPNDRWELQSDLMARIRAEHGNHGWKCYTPWGPDGVGWWLDDDLGTRFIQRAIDLGEPLICAHKGVRLPGFDALHTDPRDVGPAASRFPDVTFIIYHSAFEIGVPEGPYDPAGLGVDRLIRTIEEHELRGANVYAEMGSAWALLMNNPEMAQHYVGKLLKHVGEDNVVWGSECVYFGSPQPQIEAFRRFRISEEFQERYGYPALTDETRAKIFGRNAARLYGIDPDEARCSLDRGNLGRLKLALDEELGDRRWALQKPLGPRSRREFLSLQRWRDFLGVPA